MEFGQVLAATLSPDQRVRENATKTLETAASQNFAAYLGQLCQELCEESRSADIRQAAGLGFKNALTSKDPLRQREYDERWLQIDPSTRNRLKEQLLKALGSTNVRAGTAVSQAISAIALVELPRNQWPELLLSLLQNMRLDGSENLRRSTVEAIGFICEEINPTALESQSDQILTAVIGGLCTAEPSTAVRATAARALLNSLEFARQNFDRPHERDVIMREVCTATQAGDEAIVLPAYECLTRIVQLYYPLMGTYMNQAVAQLTVQGMQSTNESIALLAIEFWSTVCEVERDLLEAEAVDFPCQNFARSALPSLLPTLLSLLRQDGSSGDNADGNDSNANEEWNAAMAAATCLGLLCECVKNDIFQEGRNAIINFVQDNFASSNWRDREAAMMAFGSIMDGPSLEKLTPLVTQALPLLLDVLTRDSSVAVRDTTAWAVGRVIDYASRLIENRAVIGALARALAQGLKDSPRVAVNCCWSLMGLFVHFGSEDGEDVRQSDAGTPFFLSATEFELVAPSLLSAAQRTDADDSGLRSAAYQSLSSVVLYAPPDCQGHVQTVQRSILEGLVRTQRLAEQIVSIEDRMRYSEIQSLLCTVLQTCVKKLGQPSLETAAQILDCVWVIFENASKGRGSATELEDVLLLVGTLIGELDEKGVLLFVERLMPCLLGALESRAEHHLFTVAVGVVGDLARALGLSLLPYAPELMMQLLGALHDEKVVREAKPHLISAVGDVALALGGAFAVPFLPPTMQTFAQASLVTVQTEDDWDEIDFVCELREALLEAYTGIVQGVKDDQQAAIALSNNLESLLTFISMVSADPHRSETMVRSAIGLIGDLCDTFRGQMRMALAQNEILRRFIEQPLTEGMVTEGPSESTISVLRWTQNVPHPPHGLI